MQTVKRVMMMWSEKIHVQGPYNFDAVLERMSLDPQHCIDLVNKKVRVPLYIEGTSIVVDVQKQGNEFLLSGTEYQEQAAARVREIFHWHKPLDEIAEHFAQTDLQQIFKEHHGTPIVRDFDYYNCLVRCIVHQQLNLAFAHKLTERYVHTFGRQVDGVWFYPTPEVAAGLTVADLRDIQFSGRKAEYVIGLSEKIVNGELNLAHLAEQSNEAIMKELIKIRGIGRWTVENFLMFGLGRPNLFPKADIGIQNALKQLYNLERKPTEEEMEKYSESWSPFLSYASLYLWRSIEKRSEKK